MKKFIPGLFFLLFSVSVFAQNYSITGIAVDSLDNRPLIGANAVISSKKTIIAGSSTDLKGRFNITGVKPGTYTFKISFLGYKSYVKKIEVTKSSINLKTINMAPGQYSVNEVEIVDKAPVVVQKEDTTEYMADAVKTNVDATAEDLVSKMPGITVQDGTVTAHGETVQNVFVDGKPFFGSDPNAVLKNIPAEVIEKIQVYDKQSDQAEFTGFDDGNTAKTINIVTRPRFRNGTFGKLAGGYGDDDRYSTGGNMNFFNNKEKLSLLGQINNTNEQNFSNEDLLGVMSSGSGGGRGPGGGGMRGGGGGGRGPGGGGAGGGFGGGNSASDFLVSSKTGLTDTKAAGFNYTNEYAQKLDFTTSYFFNNSKNAVISSDIKNYFATTTTAAQNYTEFDNTNTWNTNHRFNMKFDYKADTNNSFLFQPRISYQKNEGNSNIIGKTSSLAEDINSTNYQYDTKLEAISASSGLLFRHRFAARGRTLSLFLNGSYSKNDGNKNLNSLIEYYKNASLSDTTDQQANLDKNGYSISSNLMYTEPIADNSMLQMNVGFTKTKDKSDQKTYNRDYFTDLYDDLDSLKSNVYDKNTNVKSAGIGYMYRKDKTMFDFGVSYNVSELNNNQTFPHDIGTEKKYYSFLPNFMFRWTMSKGNNLMVRYRASNTMPSVDQLQNYLDNTNALQLSIGNPNLSQDFKHSLSFRYSLSDFESMTSLFVIFNGTYTNNYIGYNTIIAQNTPIVFYRDSSIVLNPGTQLKTPMNLDDYYNLSSFITYSMPFDLIESILNFNLNVNYSHTPGVLNSVTNYAKNTGLGGGLVISSNISRELDFNVSVNATYNILKNTRQTSNNQNYMNWRDRLKFFWMFFDGFVLQTDLDHRYQGGLGSGYDPNSYLWNAYLGKKIFNKSQGEIRFSIYDILNKNNNTTRTANDYYIDDSRTNVLGRYYQVSFIYNVKAF